MSKNLLSKNLLSKNLDQKSQLEFIAMMASLMSIVALSIDALLPALEHIGLDIGSGATKNNQLLVSTIFLGLGFGQLIAGPISDSIGRKPVIYIGFGVFVLSSIICVMADSLEMMIVGRLLQGAGLSAPRTIAVAMVRDRFSGDYMARIMSFIVVIFILVPIVAPLFGQTLLNAYGWRSIFYAPVIIGTAILIWFWLRQPETLAIEKRIPLTTTLFKDGFLEFIKFKRAIIFTIVSGFITGSFLVYLSASQIIFQEQYKLVEEFPYLFAGLAISVGFATFMNGTLVLRYGMLRLVTIFMTLFTINSLIYLIFFYGQSNPSILVLMPFFAIQFMCLGFLFGNLRALAMEPVGHIAGVGAAINGFVSTIMAVPLAIFIGRFIDGTAVPLFIGFFICGCLGLLCLVVLRRWEGEKGE